MASPTYLRTDGLRHLVSASVMAPSSHNTQPWIFAVDDDRIELLADRDRALPVNDPEDRELTISCGAALFNLRVAAAAAGLQADVELLPDVWRPDLFAVVRLRGSTFSFDDRLVGAIPRRRTYRHAFREVPVPDAVVQRLARAAAQDGAALVQVPDGARPALAELVAEGDLAQFGDPRWRRELAFWMRPRRQRDGLSYPELTAPVARLVVTAVNLGSRIAERDRKLTRDSPLLAALVTEGDSPLDWLNTGQALEHLLLEGVVNGLQASYLNQPCQVTFLRERLREELAGSAFPQVLLRMGYPSQSVRPSPRRRLDDVMRLPAASH